MFDTRAADNDYFQLIKCLLLSDQQSETQRLFTSCQSGQEKQQSLTQAETNKCSTETIKTKENCQLLINLLWSSTGIYVNNPILSL